MDAAMRGSVSGSGSGSGSVSGSSSGSGSGSGVGIPDSEEAGYSAGRWVQALAKRNDLNDGEELGRQIARQFVDALIAGAIEKHCAAVETQDETLYGKIDDELRELTISASARCCDDSGHQLPRASTAAAAAASSEKEAADVVVVEAEGTWL